MNATVSFLLSVCASALIFSLIMLLSSDKGVKTAATAFLFVVLLKGALSLATELPTVKTQTGALTNADKTVEEIAAASLAAEAERCLQEAGCAFSAVDADVTYGDEGFTAASLTVVSKEEEAVKTALAAFSLPVTVISGGTADE